MTGFAILFRKELLESWRTRRLPVMVGLFALFGMASPLTARYLPEILRAALGDQLTIPVPAPTTFDAILQLQKNLGQLGTFAAIALAMGSVSVELDRGTAALVLAQPATRRAFLAAKLAMLAAVLAISTVVGVALGWAYTAALFEPLPVTGWIALAVLAWLALLAWTALTFLASAATGSTTAAAGLGFVAWVSLSLVAAIPAADRVLPTGLATPAMLLAAGRVGEVDSGVLATALFGTVVLIAIVLALAVASFRRREL